MPSIRSRISCRESNLDHDEDVAYIIYVTSSLGTCRSTTAKLGSVFFLFIHGLIQSRAKIYKRFLDLNTKYMENKFVHFIQNATSNRPILSSICLCMFDADPCARESQ